MMDMGCISLNICNVTKRFRGSWLITFQPFEDCIGRSYFRANVGGGIPGIAPHSTRPVVARSVGDQTQRRTDADAGSSGDAVVGEVSAWESGWTLCPEVYKFDGFRRGAGRLV